MNIVIFFLSLAIILLSCELFTNGVEWVGRRFRLSEGCVGSILAAVGTALPETLVPLIAILFLPTGAGEDIGVGAILGAPFMLVTLALFMCGIALLVFRKRRESSVLHVDSSLVRRDLLFFLIAYGMAAAVAFVPGDITWVRLILGVTLIVLYSFYVWRTVRSGAACPTETKDLYCFRAVCRLKPKRGVARDPLAGTFDRLRSDEPSTSLILFQVVAALLGIVLGANLFVEQIREIAVELAIPPLILALIIAPVATELPEKFNSIMWIRSRKDTFAIGNITGAMVFQSCIPVTIGLILTSWHIDLGEPEQIIQAASIGIALFSGVLLFARSNGKDLTSLVLLSGGVFYLLFILLVLGLV